MTCRCNTRYFRGIFLVAVIVFAAPVWTQTNTPAPRPPGDVGLQQSAGGGVTGTTSGPGAGSDVRPVVDPRLQDAAAPVRTGSETLPARRKDRSGFWIAGAIVNIAALSAFIWWSVGQWRKKKR